MKWKWTVTTSIAGTINNLGLRPFSAEGARIAGS
jgi:hypothetical protein